ncbi:MAG: DUF4339 domain-containing protein [Planctomycetota bacterium]
MDSTRNWYYSIGNDRQGPVDEATLKALARTGKLKPHDRVWHPDFDDWRTARDIPEIPFPDDALGESPQNNGTLKASVRAAGLIGLLTGILGLLGYGFLVAALSLRNARSPVEDLLLGIDTVVLLLCIAMVIQSTCLLLQFRWAQRLSGGLCFALIIGSLTSSVILVMLPSSPILHGFNVFIAAGAIAVNFLISPSLSRK